MTRLLQSWIKKQKKLKKGPDIKTKWQNYVNFEHNQNSHSQIPQYMGYHISIFLQIYFYQTRVFKISHLILLNTF